MKAAVEMEGGPGTKRSSAVEDEGQAAILLMPDIDGILVHIFVSLQLEALHVGDLTVFHSQER